MLSVAKNIHHKMSIIIMMTSLTQLVPICSSISAKIDFFLQTVASTLCFTFIDSKAFKAELWCEIRSYQDSQGWCDLDYGFGLVSGFMGLSINKLMADRQKTKNCQCSWIWVVGSGVPSLSSSASVLLLISPTRNADPAGLKVGFSTCINLCPCV